MSARNIQKLRIYGLIESLIVVHGSANTFDIANYFGLKRSWISLIISEYKKRYPNNIKYDTVNKYYVRDTSFKVLALEEFFGVTAFQYLGAFEILQVKFLDSTSD